MRVVFDTNIYLSALVFPGSKPALLFEAARSGRFELYCTSFILDELKRNLMLKFGYSEPESQKFVQEILKVARVIKSASLINIIKEKISDNRILECAVAAKANYLITGDKKHILPLQVIAQTKIISAADFIEIIG